MRIMEMTIAMPFVAALWTLQMMEAVNCSYRSFRTIGAVGPPHKSRKFNRYYSKSVNPHHPMNTDALSRRITHRKHIDDFSSSNIRAVFLAMCEISE